MSGLDRSRPCSVAWVAAPPPMRRRLIAGSPPCAWISAAAASTSRINLGTTVTVLSTDDPIRVFEQLATAASLAPGRIEVVAGRGSSSITFPLFDYDEHDYDLLFASKLELLL